MPRTSRPLPANRVFVIQLRAGEHPSDMIHAGRAEHLTSGQAARFTDEAEFWAFIDAVLSEMAEREGPQ